MNLLGGVGLDSCDKGLGYASRTNDSPAQAWHGAWVDDSGFRQPHDGQFRAVSCIAPIAEEEDYVWQIHNLFNSNHSADSNRF